MTILENRPKSIGMILDGEFPPDPRVNNEAQALLKQGHEISLFCLGKPGDKRRELVDGIQLHRFIISPKIYKKIHALVYSFPFYKMLLKMPVTNFINRGKFDIIHIHDMIIASVALPAAKKARVKTILDLHENRPAIMPLYTHVNSGLGKYLINIKKWELKQIELAELADKVIVVTPEAKQDLLSSSSKTGKDIISVPNSVEIDRFKAYEINNEISNKYENKFVILYLGNTGLRRGTELAVKSVKKMLNIGMENFLLLLVGGSRDNQFLKNLIDSEGVQNYVEMTGWQDENLFPSYLKNADVCISPLKKNRHHDTTYANKIFQYMCYAKPVVGSNCDAQETVIKDASCGLIHEAGNTDDFVQKIKQIYDDPDLREQMGKSGYEALQSKYDWKIMQKNLINLYEHEWD